MITVSQEQLSKLDHCGEPLQVGVACWDDGEAVVVLEDGQSARETGILARAREGAAVGQRVPEYAHAGLRAVVMQFDHPSATVLGWIRSEEQWHEARVEVIPLRDDLYSRVRGILETAALADKTVVLVGLGSVGSTIAVELAKCGVMRFVLWDPERLKVVNVCRHYAGLSHVGRFKTKFLRDAILEKNPYAQVTTHEVGVAWENLQIVRDCLRQADLGIGSPDNQEARIILNKACVDEGRPLILAGAFRRAFGGQVFRIRPRRSFCYQCFLGALDTDLEEQAIPREVLAEPIAYSDRPVPIEPGLSNDIAPISTMAVKLAIQELLQGKPTTLRSLDEDLTASWFIWVNRREVETDFAALKPLACDIDGMHVLRWYGVRYERVKTCPACGEYNAATQEKLGMHISEEEALAFAQPSLRE